MSDLHLIVGNKNYSSWSMRAWLVLAESGLPFRETRIALHEPGSAERKLAFSPAGRVPVLIDGDFAVWDSLAIAETIAERVPSLWPADARARARARSLCAEMHSGFQSVRSEMPMNCRAHKAPRPRSDAVQREIARLAAIWSDTRAEFGAGGELLFCAFTIADAFFAPVASRFATYGVTLEGRAAEYAAAILARPSVARWIRDAAAESESIAEYDATR